MTMHENTVKEKWFEIKGDIKRSWGKLTDDELEKTKGDIKEIGSLLQKRYGDEKDNYGKKLTDIFKRFETKKPDDVDYTKSSMKN